MKPYKSHHAADRAAAGRAYLTIIVGGKRLYIVPEDGEVLKQLDEVSIVSATGDGGGREVTGFINLGHLDRLGNGNGAGSSLGEWHRRKTFAVDQRRGLMQSFNDPAEAAIYEADQEKFLEASRSPFWIDEARQVAFLDRFSNCHDARRQEVRDAVRDRRIADQVQVAADGEILDAVRAAFADGNLDPGGDVGAWPGSNDADRKEFIDSYISDLTGQDPGGDVDAWPGRIDRLPSTSLEAGFIPQGGKRIVTYSPAIDPAVTDPTPPSPRLVRDIDPADLDLANADRFPEGPMATVTFNDPRLDYPLIRKIRFEDIDADILASLKSGPFNSIDVSLRASWTVDPAVKISAEGI